MSTSSSSAVPLPANLVGVLEDARTVERARVLRVANVMLATVATWLVTAIVAG